MRWALWFLLVGLLLNAWLGWAWADPLAGLVIAVVALREGVQAWFDAQGRLRPGAAGDGKTDERVAVNDGGRP